MKDSNIFLAGMTFQTNDHCCLTHAQKFLWTPTYTLTDVLTVKCLWSIVSGSTVRLNQSGGNTNTNVYVVGTSSLTLWEIN